MVFKSINLEQAIPQFYNLIDKIHSFKTQSLVGEIWGQGKERVVGAVGNKSFQC